MHHERLSGRSLTDFLEDVLPFELARTFQEERTVQKCCKGCPVDDEQEMRRELKVAGREGTPE